MTVQFADPFVVVSGVAESTTAVAAAVSRRRCAVAVVAGVSGVASWPASLVVAAVPVQALVAVDRGVGGDVTRIVPEVDRARRAAARWPTRSAPTRCPCRGSRRSSASVLDAVLVLPAALSSRPVLASRIAASSSAPDPVLLLSHTPPSVPHSDSAP